MPKRLTNYPLERATLVGVNIRTRAKVSGIDRVRNHAANVRADHDNAADRNDRNGILWMRETRDSTFVDVAFS